MMGRNTRIAASSRTLAKLRTRTRTSVTARGAEHTLAALSQFFGTSIGSSLTTLSRGLASLAALFAFSFSLAARADDQTGVQSLISKVSWTGNPTVIYILDSVPVSTNALPADGKFDNLVLKYTDTSADGTLTLDDTIRANARVLVVGGGGAGGSGGGGGNNRGAGGGGGAGGYLYDSSVTLIGGVYTAVVGTGGVAAAAESKTAGGNGQSSLFKSSTETLLEAFGGGGGGAESDGLGGDNLGSGGGGSRQYTTSGTTHYGGVSTTGQGNNGGTGSQGRTAGGGGGAGGVGGNGTIANVGGAGGVGLQNDITGESLYYAGGGGGGTKGADIDGVGVGGAGGGGNGGGDPVPTAGASNTGGGGGGGTLDVAGAAGGSGVVIVRITQLVETKVALPSVGPFTFNKSNQVALDFGIAYTYVRGTTNATAVGNYSFVVTPGPDLEWNAAAGGGTGEKTVNWSIVTRTIEKPVATNYVYDTTDKVGVTYVAELPEYCTFDASSVTNATNAGTYTFSVSLDDPVNTAWADNTIEPFGGSWTIAPQTVAVPTPKTDLVYDGTEKQGFDSLDYEHYVLSAGVINATAGGTHQFTFSLLGNGTAVNYVWDTDPVSAEPYSGEWTIAPAANAVTKPILEGWRLGTTPNVPSATALYGEVNYAYVFGEDLGNVADWVYDTSLINTDGVWTVIAMVDATPSWNGATNSSQFAMWDDPVKLFRDHVDIKVTPPAGSSETFTNFVALVKISEERFYGFEYARAGSDGNKLMFLDRDSNTLPFDVDTWRTTGESLVWVLIPSLPPAGTTITMYWNLKEGRTPPPNNPEEVWLFYSGVWHMNETITSAQATTAISYDSTTNNNYATPTKGSNGNLGQMISTTGRIGNARVNSSSASVAQGNRLETARTNIFFNGVFTFSGWYKMNGKANYPRLVGTKVGAIDSDGWSIETAQASSTSLYVRGNGGSAYDGAVVDDMLNNWVYLTFVYNNGTASVYSNAKLSKSGGINKVKDTAQPLTFGAHGKPNGSEYSLNGAYDELRITGQALSAARIAAEYATVVSNDFTVQGSAVSRDDLKRNYWVTLPSMDKTDWDVADTPGVITNGGTLAFCGVTNYIYSVYDPTQTFESTTNITEVGYYRVVFLPDDSEGYEPISYTIEIHVVEGKPYSDIVGSGGNSGRVLLMNNHIGEAGHPDINYQGWFDADNAGAYDGSTPTYWHHENLSVPADTTKLPNLKNGTESTLHAADGRRLWHIIACRHGNTFPRSNGAALDSLQNYLPFDDTYANRITEHDEDRSATRATAGQLVMQNTTDAGVYSSCFTNGIGTIYFDAVNGWKPLSVEEHGYYNLVVEIATNTVEGLVPTDINSVTYTVEKDPDTEEVTAIITNWYGNLESCWHAVPVIPYKRDGTANFEKGVKTEELMLDVENGGTMDNFFRVVVPLDIAGPVRFRIRRTTCAPESVYQVDEAGFILLDNIIASIPAMSADLVSAGHYDEEKTGSQTLGWELATSVPYPSVDDTDNIVVYAKPEFTLNAGDGSTPATNKFFSSATMHYRWRYLNQTLSQPVSAWKDIALNPGDDFKAIRPLELPSRPGDVEYWFEYRLQAPYYKYVDYSGASNAAIDYTEERGVLTNRLDDASIASGGSNWYFRIRVAKSDYSGLDIVFKRGTSETPERVHMSLAEDHVWRGFVQTKEDQTGTIKYRIEALDRQTEQFAEYAATTNYWRCRVDNPSFPVSDSLEPGTVDSWSTLTLDAVTGYVMFQIDDSSQDSMALTVVHADYQDANGWSDALGRSGHDKDGKVVSPVFVGTSTTNAYKVGVSPTKQTFDDDFSGWGDMAVTNESWTFVTGLTDIKSNHMYGRKTYETFASDTNGLWEVGQGQWIAKKYRDDRDNAGVALQMEGYGKGYLQFTDSAKAPRGLESISFNARLTQSIRFEDFAYYFGGDENILNLQNYTFVARTAFDLNKNKDFTGNASLSVVANYLPNKGCYEARWEWLGNNNTAQRGQRLCLYRWNVTSSGTKEPELIVARTNTTFHVEELTALSNNSTQRFAPLFISVSNDVPNKCTYVVAGIRRCGVALGTKPIGTSALDTSNGRNANWFGVCFKDTDQAKRLAKGSYGVLSANCPGVFAHPEFSHTTQVAVGQFPSNGKLRDSFDSSSLSQVSNLQNVKNCATDDLKDTDYPGWNIMPGRNSVTYTDADVNAVIGSAPAQELLLYLGTAGRGDWGSTPYKRITVNGFGGATETVPLYTTKDCSVRFAVGSASSDLAIDTVTLRQWRGGDWNGSDVQAEGIAPSWTTAPSGKQSAIYTNFVFTSCWTKNNDILMSAKRSNLETPCAIRSPLMDYMANDGRGGDGYHRGIGLGMISIGYKNAQPNASLLLQIATNAVDYTMVDTFDKSFSETYWTTVTNYNFALMTDAQRSSGVLNTYLGLHSVTGMMRVVVNTNTINAVASVTDTSRFGEVTITSVVCNDEPPVDVHSWWGWNLRTVGGDKDTEKMMLLDDFSTEPGGAGLAIALNNSVDETYGVSMIDVSDRESYIQHKPFVQTPTFTSNVVGEVSFKARKYNAGDEPATVVLFGSKDASETDDGTWVKIANAVFTVTNDWYETYSYKTDPGESFKAFRLAVVGVFGIQEDESGGGNGRIPGAADPPVRVLLDELFVSEAVRARMGFRNVGCFKSDMSGTDAVLNVPSPSEQPLCGEAWGVQCEIYGAQLASDIDFDHTPQVRLHWFDQGAGGTVEGGVMPWGYDKWKDMSGHNSAFLSPATDSSDGHYVYRSSQRTSPGAVIGASMSPPKYVQYTLEVIYYTKGSTVPTTNWLSSADWEIPSWYHPLDFNASLGGGSSFAAYNILDNVAPGWAWINEVNVFGLFDDGLQNTDAECQYIEIVQPPEADISGWSVRILDAQIDNKMVVTNTLATFGTGDLDGLKDARWIDPTANKVFRVIANQQARDTGKLKYEDGTLDGVWHLETTYLTNMSGDSLGNTEISSYLPFAIQLVRSSGIVEHEIVAMGTNWWWDLPLYLERYHPTNTVNFLNANMAGSSFFYVGMDDDGGEPKSLGVFQGNGSVTNDWNNTMDKTPGRINIGQTIGDHPRPNPVNILIYMTVDGSHILQSLDGTTFTNEMFMLSVPKGSLNGTNVTYSVDPWYVVGSATTNGVDAMGSLTPTITTQPRQYVLSGVGKGASNNVTVVARAALDPRLTDLGIDENNPYRDAIVDWLQGGTDIYGNPFADVESGEIRLAQYCRMNGEYYKDMTLTEMYWLDLDPTMGNLALLGGMASVEPIMVPKMDGSGEMQENVRMDVYMMFTNRNQTVTMPATPRGINDFGTHWTPYVLRGLDPKSSSLDYDDAAGDWPAETFKITARLLNSYTQEGNVTNQAPMRLFVFQPDSFTADGITKVEIEDPHSYPPFVAWWEEYGPCGIVYFWSLDERKRLKGVEILKQENYYVH